MDLRTSRLVDLVSSRCTGGPWTWSPVEAQVAECLQADLSILYVVSCFSLQSVGSQTGARLLSRLLIKDMASSIYFISNISRIDSHSPAIL